MVDFNGTYNCKAEGPMGEQPAVLSVSTESGSVTGEYQGNPLTFGELRGNEFELKTTASTPLGELEVTISGTVNGNKIVGNVATPLMTGKISGTRI